MRNKFKLVLPIMSTAALAAPLLTLTNCGENNPFITHKIQREDFGEIRLGKISPRQLAFRFYDYMPEQNTIKIDIDYDKATYPKSFNGFRWETQDMAKLELNPVVRAVFYLVLSPSAMPAGVNFVEGDTITMPISVKGYSIPYIEGEEPELLWEKTETLKLIHEAKKPE